MLELLPPTLDEQPTPAELAAMEALWVASGAVLKGIAGARVINAE